jgi:hypothetical protein
MRDCKDPKCTAKVNHSRYMGGYCSGRVKHWNDGESVPWWIKCECGADSTKTKAKPTPVHSDWCPVDKFKKAN